MSQGPLFLFRIRLGSITLHINPKEASVFINKYFEIKSNQNSLIRIDSELLKSGSIYNAIYDYCNSYNIKFLRIKAF